MIRQNKFIISVMSAFFCLCFGPFISAEDFPMGEYVEFPNYGAGTYLHTTSDGVKSWILNLKKFEISADGSTWIAIGEGDVNLDIAAADAGQTLLDNYAISTNIPPATYQYYRLTLGAYSSLKGGCQDPNNPGTYYYTTHDYEVFADPSEDDSRTGKASTNLADYDICNMKVNTYSDDPGFGGSNGGDYFTWTQLLPQAFTIIPGAIKKITMTFNIGAGIVFIPGGWGFAGVMFDMGGDLLPEITVVQ